MRYADLRIVQRRAINHQREARDTRSLAALASADRDLEQRWLDRRSDTARRRRELQAQRELMAAQE